MWSQLIVIVLFSTIQKNCCPRLAINRGGKSEELYTGCELMNTALNTLNEKIRNYKEVYLVHVL